MKIEKLMQQVKEKEPLVQCITNFVTVNDCANILLSIGATPTMAMDCREVEEAVAKVSALVCNMGAIEHLESMLLAGKEANRLHIPVVGVIPMEQIDLDDEDSLSERLDAGKRRGDQTEAGDEQPYLDLAVIHLPHISNFTDFNPLEQGSGARLRYVSCVSQLGQPDLLILPGTKNTMADLAWMRENGLEEEVIRLVEEKKIPLIGICGGYQMLGEGLQDLEGAEGVPGSSMKGMGLLHAETIFASRKTRTRITGRVQAGGGIL